MSATAKVKNDRMHLRLDAKSKRLLDRAATYEATSLSDFVLGHALTAAEQIIEQREKFTLAASDWEAFHDALLNPPEPNAMLKAAASRYHERSGA